MWGCGGFRITLRFLCAVVKQLEIRSWNFLTFKGHPLRTFCEIFGPRSGQVTRSRQLTLLKKKLAARHGYISHRITMKGTGLLEVISPYGMYVSEFLSW